MEWTIDKRPAYPVLKVKLSPGEKVSSEPGAMMLIKGNIKIETKSGGILKGLARKLMAGESFFLNHYYAGPGGGEIWFVPGVPGDIEAINLSGGAWIIQDTSYLAHHGDIDISIAWRGMKGLLAEGELVWVKAQGHGIVWVNSYGAIEKIKVDAGEKIVIDNMHFVAMPANVNYKIVKVGGLKTFFLGGEGLAVEVYGPAEVLVQTRILPPLARLLARFIRTR
ncbi:MAG: TIGR00266 family protein [Desulfurococcales archaeon]|nr:TIGR00266 family protein [Desulfurococcales archaeon]